MMSHEENAAIKDFMGGNLYVFRFLWACFMLYAVKRELLTKSGQVTIHGFFSEIEQHSISLRHTSDAVWIRSGWTTPSATTTRQL